MKRFAKTLRSLMLCTLLCFPSLDSLAQTGVITGRVIDSKTKEPLALANVFFNNTTIGTTTDLQGNFVFNRVAQLGLQEIIISFVGYDLLLKSVILSSADLHLGEIELSQQITSLEGIEVVEKRDRDWEKKLEKFKKIFLGTTSIAEECTILNPWVINFSDDRRSTLVESLEPIQVRNDYLGYHIYFYLNRSSIESVSYSIQGGAMFRELEATDDEQTLRWAENRYQTYLKSSRHLFKSIIEGNAKDKGFKLFEDARPDGWHKEATDNFRTLLSTEKVKEKVVTEMIFPDSIPNVKRILIDRRLEVHYSKARTRVPAYDDVIYPVSWLLVKGGYLRVSANGIALNIDDLITSGDMNEDWITRMLPVDYRPPLDEKIVAKTEEDVDRFREQIYVHTDKPYYYPGEMIWFKSYLNYREFDLRNSLSRIVYVDFIDPKEKVIASKRLLVNQGTAAGEFRLSDSLAAGGYHLRAYTTLMRNFGDSALFVRPISVLKITDRAEAVEAKELTPAIKTVAIISDKAVYAPRERIKLRIETFESERPISSNASISVVDQYQVATINDPSILNAFAQEGNSKTRLSHLSFPVETGITVSGKVVDKKKGAQATLTMVDVYSKEMFLIETDRQGLFWVSGLGFYDSASFLLQAKNRKGKSFGTVSISDPEKPTFYFSGAKPKLQLRETESPQRIESAYTAQERVTVLDGIEIKSTRIPEEYQQDYRVKRPYGKPDYVLKGEDLEVSYGSLLLALPGKFPGLIVRQTGSEIEENRWAVYLQRSVSLGKPRQVLVTLNDVAVGGSNPARFLDTIDPATVESIELKSGINVLYGDQGGFGVLAIYTKTKSSNLETKHLPNFQQVSIGGYARPEEFQFPNYDDPSIDTSFPDYRSTIYWNPNVITDRESGVAEVSFFAADLPGKYRVVVEGLTYGGLPVRGELQLTIEDN
ncbi:MAG: carboxypeptidase-like regulatory domain-containing protein [Cyclobacteriaceae bacterium]